MKNGNPRKADRLEYECKPKLIKIEKRVLGRLDNCGRCVPMKRNCSMLIPVSGSQAAVAVAETDRQCLDCYQTSWAVAAVAVAAAAVAVDWCYPSMKAATVDCS